MMDGGEQLGRRPSFRVPTNGTSDVGKAGKKLIVGFNSDAADLFTDARERLIVFQVGVDLCARLD